MSGTENSLSQPCLNSLDPRDSASPAPAEGPSGPDARPGWWRSRLDRLQSSGLVYRLAHGAFWSLAGTVLGRGLTFASYLFIARLLGREIFGELGIVQSTIMMFQVVAGFSLGLTATKFVSECRHRDPDLAGRVIALTTAFALTAGTIMTLLLVGGADLLARSTLNAPGMAGPLRIAAILLLLGALNGAQTGALSGFEAFREMARVNTLTGLVSFFALVGGAWWGGLDGVLWGMVAVAALTAVLNRSVIREYQRRDRIQVRWQDGFREVGILWQFSLPAVLGSLVVVPVNWACNALLVNQPDGYAEMGQFNAMANWRAVLIYVPMVINQVAVPIMSSQSDPRATMRIVFSVMVTIAFPLAAGAMFLSSEILGLYGPDFASGASVLIGGMAMLLFQCISVPIMSSLWSKGRMWLCFALNVLWGAVMLGFTAATVKSWGADAVAYGGALAHAVQTLVTFGLMSDDVPPGMLRRVVLSTALTAVLVTSSLALSPASRTLLALPVVVATALLSVFVLADPQFLARARELLGRRHAS